MLLELHGDDDKSVELKIKEEDISILYIVQHELLKNKDIEFAGVVLKHQLIKDFVLRIISKGDSVIETLHKSVESGIEEIGNIKQILESQFKTNGESGSV
ncbi:MAG TPA: RpoL/Rpb11 RNA polymerase subunit family protein [Nitrososphaeraceae archaeon]|jgi:DNA-directed RNA polymerase subunit L